MRAPNSVLKTEPSIQGFDDPKQLIIVVRTLLTETPTNYGCVLQAFALVRHLESFGATVYVDISPHSSGSWVRRINGRVQTRKTFHSLAIKAVKLLRAPGAPEANPFAALQAFVEKEIKTCRVFPAKSPQDEAILADANCFVAGSDQVWRPRYSDLDSAFFRGFESVPKIAYAASFGIGDRSEYSDELARETGKLVRGFSHVSVRESSAISICEELWELEASQTLDPALLPTVEFWDRLLDSEQGLDRVSTKRDARCYLLNQSRKNKAKARQLCEERGYNPVMLPPTRSNLGGFIGSLIWPSKYQMPSVSSWLRGIKESDFIVTDSYHATLFAIIFNIEFMVVEDSQKGSSRFSSILELLGLGDRLIRGGATFKDPKPIDWKFVNRKLSRERLTSLAFLQTAIGSELAD